MREGEKNMYGFIAGVTDNDDISFCPKCGERVTDFFADGTAKCEKCDYRFGVIEREEFGELE